jgi:hypothetical protein
MIGKAPEEDEPKPEDRPGRKAFRMVRRKVVMQRKGNSDAGRR